MIMHSFRHSLLRIYFLAMVALSAGTLCAQVPTITSFSPTSGSVGTTVTISGTNFSTTPANNIVWFGAVRATVTAASVTQLMTTVPFGASYEPISVTVGGLTAYSGRPFSVMYTGTQGIDASTFNQKLDIAMNTSPLRIALRDIDIDGKPDIIVTKSSTDGYAISFLRNISTTGSFSESMFAAQYEISTGDPQPGIAIGDIDGDGKLDLVISNRSSSSVSVFRNTSTSGSINSGSFSAREFYTTGSVPGYIAISDIDGDGKPDIIVLNETSNSFSVLRNTSITGTISSTSFASKVDFATGNNPLSVAVGDIDGDGKPEVITANFNSNTVSVFRNTSVSGSISSSSFDAMVDFATGSGSNCVAVADIDSDGKLDLIVNNHNTNTVSVFRNTSSPGVIGTSSFATKIDFGTGEGPNSITVGDIDGDGNPDLAVAGSSSSYGISVLRNISTPGSVSFAGKISFISGGSSDIAIGDLEGDGKPELVGTSHVVSVLFNSTVSEPPVITSFNPTSGYVGSTVTINGSNFSSNGPDNIVRFGGLQADIQSATPTQITVIVPNGATSGPISITVRGQTGYSSNPFMVTQPPVIMSVNPTSGPVGSTVTINGSNFSTEQSNNVVRFGDIQATLISSTPNQLTVIVPGGTDGQEIIVSISGYIINTGFYFELTQPEGLELESSILTLNGDGINEHFVVKNFQAYGASKFYVYNGRGALVYWNDDFQGEWDVTLHNRRFDTGGYFYVIETSIGTFRGSFSILKN